MWKKNNRLFMCSLQLYDRSIAIEESRNTMLRLLVVCLLFLFISPDEALARIDKGI